MASISTPEVLGKPDTQGIAGQIVANQQKAIQGYSGQNADAQARILSYYKNNPNAMNDPAQVYGLATNLREDPNTVTQALKYLSLYNEGTKHIYEQANGSNLGHQIWHGITSVGNTIWDSLTSGENWKNAFARPVMKYVNFWTQGDVGQKVINADISGAKGAADAVVGLGKVSSNVLNRVDTTLAELAGAQGINGYKDAWRTVNNFAQAPINLINPFSDQNGYQLMAHTMAYYESLANQKGWAYALGHMLPSIAAMYASDGFLAPGIAGETETSEYLSAMSEAEQALAKGEKLTAEQKRLIDASPKVKELERQAKMEGPRGPVANIADKVSTPFSGIARFAKMAGKPMTDVKLNALYLLNQETAKIEHHQLWEDTKGGVVIGSDGKPKDLGRQTLEYFGMNPTGAFFDTTSGLFDIYTKYLGADPLGAAGKVFAAARSFEGLSPRLADFLETTRESLFDMKGNRITGAQFKNDALLGQSYGRAAGKLNQMMGGLGIWFRGLGIHNAGDIYATSRLANVATSYQYMATHTGSEIARAFRGVYSDKVIKLLDKAKTFNDVVDVHAMLADGYGMVHDVAPTLGMYGKIKTVLVDANKVMDDMAISAILNEDMPVLKRWAKAFKERGYDVTPDSAMFIASAKADLRWRTIFRRWCFTQLSRSPMYYSEVLQRMETHVIVPGDYNAIAAIQDMARGAFVPEREVVAMGDTLYATSTPEDYVTAYRNCLYNIVMRNATAGMRQTELDSVSKMVENHIWDEVVRMTGLDGGGALKRVYTAGPNGYELSKLVDAEGKEFTAANGTQQLGHLRMPLAKDIRNLSRTIRNEITKVTPDTRNIHDFTAWDNEIRSIATERGLLKNEVSKYGKEIAKYRSKGFKDSKGYAVLSERGIKSYNKAVEEIDKLANATYATPDLGQEFTNFYNTLHTKYKDVAQQIEDHKAAMEELAHRRANPAMEFDTPAPKPLSPQHVESLKGQLHAYNDHLMSANLLLNPEQIVKEEQAMLWAREQAGMFGPGDVAKTKIAERFKNNLDEIKKDRPNYRSNFQVVVDGLNRTLSLVFVPLALLSGRWAMHVGLSEGALNAFRQGPFKLFEQSLAKSIAKHELNGIPLAEGGLRDKQVSLLRDVVAGTIMGMESSFLRAMNPEKADRLIGDAVSLHLRHDGWKGGVHGNDTVMPDMPGKTEDIFTINGEGTVSQGKAVRTDDMRVLNPNTSGYSTALSEWANMITNDKIFAPVAKELHEKIVVEGHEFWGTRGSDTWRKDIADNLLPTARKAINDLTPEEAARMRQFDGINANPNLSSMSMQDRELLKVQREAEVGRAEALQSMSPDLRYIQDSIDKFHGSGGKLESFTSGETSPADLAKLEKDFAPIKQLEEDAKKRIDSMFEGKDVAAKSDVLLTPEYKAGNLEYRRYGVTNAAFELHRDKGLNLIVARDSEGKITGALAWYETGSIHVQTVGSLGGGAGAALEHELATQIVEKYGYGVKHRYDIEFGSWPYHEKTGKIATADWKGQTTEAMFSAEQIEKIAALKPMPSALGMSADEKFRLASKEDAARRAVENIMGTFFGTAGSEGHVLHTELLDHVVSGTVPGPKEMTELIARMGDSAPRDIPARGLEGISSLGGFAKTVISRVSEQGHDKILGPMVNWLVRKPVYLGDYHREMEILRPLINNGTLHEAQAEIIAENKALMRMSRFVHNPKDKTMFETNMRVVAPFYFAKNQAWRRAFRLAKTDPGAFEKYMKLCLAVTDYISTTSDKGAIPGTHIPGTEFIGNIAGLNPLFNTAAGFGKMAFGLTGSAGSVTSIVPTGDEMGFGNMLGEFIRPPWGPLITVPAKWIRDYTAANHSPVAQKWINGFLGKASSYSSWTRDVLPSGTLQDVLELGAGMFNMPNSTIQSTENEMLNNAVDNLFAQQRKIVEKEYDYTGMTQAQRDMMVRGLTDQAVSNILNDPEQRQAFLDRAKQGAMMMSFVKTVLNFFSPLALSLNATFSKQPEFDKILAEKNPDGTPKYTTIEAADIFAQKFPDNITDLISHTNSTYANFPETQSAVNLLTNNPGTVRDYPYGSAMLVNRSSNYSPQAYQLELSMNLRSREAPSDYLNSALYGIGNDYYYNFLKPEIMAIPGATEQVIMRLADGSSKATTELNYNGFKQLAAMAKSYGDTTNPTWYDQFTGAAKKNVANKALEEMTKMVDDPNVTAISKDDKEKFKSLINEYNGFLKAYHNLTGSGASALSNSWYAFCEDAAASDYYANQSYFIKSVLQAMPNK